MDSSSRDMPTSVTVAAQLRFTSGITAFLYRPTVDGFSLVGLVYRDWKDRFKSGRLIRTSIVREFEEEHGYLIAVTLTGSRYVLIEPYAGELGQDEEVNDNALTTPSEK